MTYAKNAPGHHPRAKSCIINGLVVSNKALDINRGRLTPLASAATLGNKIMQAQFYYTRFARFCERAGQW